MQTIEVKQEVKLERVADLLTNSIEVASKYWSEIVSFNEPKELTFRTSDAVIYKHIDFPLNEGGAVVMKDTEDGEGAPVTIDLERIKQGLQIMATKFPNHFGDFMAEEDDNTTADVFLQCVMLGDIKYA